MTRLKWKDDRVRCMKVLALRARYAVYQSLEQERYESFEHSKLLELLCPYLAQAMEAGLREVCRSVRIGKILIQRVSGLPSLG